VGLWTLTFFVKLLGVCQRSPILLFCVSIPVARNLHGDNPKVHLVMGMMSGLMLLPQWSLSLEETSLTRGWWDGLLAPNLR
jgi:hypothetical protein